MNSITSFIRDVPDYPKPGIIFKDITPLLGDANAFAASIDAMCDLVVDDSPEAIVGIESRGFIFGAAIARQLNVGFIPVRKPGKLPADTLSQSYDLEYGQDSIEIHSDALDKHRRIVVVDDVIATGGTLAAACDLVDRLGGEVVSCLTLIELGFLQGRLKLGSNKFHSVITY